MKVLLDTNIFISYLLHPDIEGTIQKVLELAFEGKYVLLVPQAVTTELHQKLTTKSYLKKYIYPVAAQNFITAITTIGVIVLSITDPLPHISRDKNDDFLLAYAVSGEADYLVTGDSDLLVLQEVAGVQIIDPKRFLSLVNK